MVHSKMEQNAGDNHDHTSVVRRGARMFSSNIESQWSSP